MEQGKMRLRGEEKRNGRRKEEMAREEARRPIIVDGEEEFLIDKIIKQRRRGGENEYLVRWKGQGAEEDTWISRRGLIDTEALEIWEKSGGKLVVSNIGYFLGQMYSQHCQEAITTQGESTRALGGLDTADFNDFTKSPANSIFESPTDQDRQDGVTAIVDGVMKEKQGGTCGTARSQDKIEGTGAQAGTAEST